MSAQPRYKPLTLFVIAAAALLLAGLLSDPDLQLMQTIILTWCGFCGVFIVYRFNDLSDKSYLRYSAKRIFSNRLHIAFAVQFVLITTPAVFLFLEPYRILLLAINCMIGIIYSVGFQINKKYYRLKNFFIVKNMVIGACWGSLILIGAGYQGYHTAFPLFCFTAIQVMIGSTIRDIPDIEHDTEHQVNTLPVKIGLQKTIFILHLINIFSFITAFLVSTEINFRITAACIVLWRSFTLYRVNHAPEQKRWTHTFNLLTCVLIFVISLISYACEYYQRN